MEPRRIRALLQRRPATSQPFPCLPAGAQTAGHTPDQEEQLLNGFEACCAFDTA